MARAGAISAARRLTGSATMLPHEARLIFVDANQVHGPNGRPRRKMSEPEKADRRRRYRQCCAKCAKQKRKCRHEVLTITPREAGGEGEVVHKFQQVDVDVDSRGKRPSTATGQAALALRLATPQRLPRPTLSPDTLAAAVLHDCILWGGCSDLWFALLPIRYGHCSRLDAAINAVVIVTHNAQGILDANFNRYYAAMAIALKALHQAMSDEKERMSDFTLATVAVLSPCEAIMVTKRLGFVTVHAKGLSELLVERAGRVKMTELAAKVFYDHVSDDFMLSCRSGVSSRLERVQDYYLNDAPLHRSQNPAVMIRRAGTQLSLAIPRLVTYVRRARARKREDTSTASALALAERLCQLDDVVVNTEFRRRVAIVETTVLEDQAITATSLSFLSEADFHSALLYWPMRIALLRICTRLYKLDAAEYAACKLPSECQIRDELQRLGKSVVLSSQASRKHMGAVRKRLYTQGLLMCWGVLYDARDRPSASGCEKSLSIWLSSRLHECLGNSTALTFEDLDIAAEIFAGGPLVGKFRTLFVGGESA